MSVARVAWGGWEVTREHTSLKQDSKSNGKTDTGKGDSRKTVHMNRLDPNLLKLTDQLSSWCRSGDDS